MPPVKQPVIVDVKELLAELTQHLKPVDDVLIKQLTSKVDDHDKSLMMMAKTMEDINKILGDFASNMKTYQSDQIKHWQNQDRNAMQTEQILKQLADGTKKFEQIEERQHTGCPMFLSHAKESNILIDGFKQKEASILTDLKEVKKEVDELQTKCTTIITENIATVKKVEALETQRNWGAMLIITSFVGLIVTIIKLAMGVK